MYRLILVLLLLFKIEFALANGINDIDSVLQNVIEKKTFRFFYAGHVYGSHKGKDYWKNHKFSYPHPGLVENIPRLKLHDFGVFGGDIVERCNESSIEVLETTLLNPLSIPILNSTGNHDHCLPERYQYDSRIAFVIQQQLFLIISSSKNDLSSEDHAWLLTKLSSTHHEDSINRVFLFTHRPFFFQLGSNPEKWGRKANIKITQNAEFKKDFGDLISRYPKNEELFWFSGDMGIKSAIFYDNVQENVHFIASGLYERENDHFISVEVSPDGVRISIEMLNEAKKPNTGSISIASWHAVEKHREPSTQKLLRDMTEKTYLATGIKEGISIESQLTSGTLAAAFLPYYYSSRRIVFLKKENCSDEAVGKKVFVRFHPELAADRDIMDKPWNDYHYSAKRTGINRENCVVIVGIPDYPIDLIEAGQLDEQRKSKWRLMFEVPD